MYPELFRINIGDWLKIGDWSIPIHGYGLMIVIGLLVALELAKFLARRSNLDPELFVNVGILALVVGIVGARLSHVLENIDQYTDPSRSAWANLLDAANIASGGLTFFGGLILAAPAVIAFLLWKKLPLRLSMDISAPTIMVALGFGRLGCLLFGCCYGQQCDLPWAVRFPYGSHAYTDHYRQGAIQPPEALLLQFEDGVARPLTVQEIARVEQIDDNLRQTSRDAVRADLLAEMEPTPGAQAYADAIIHHAERFGNQDLAALAGAEGSAPVHPAQVYSAINAWLIAGVLFAFFTVPHVPGRVFALMLVMKGTSRFILEMLRTEPAVLGSLSFSMVVSVGLVIAGVGLWFFLRWIDGRVSVPERIAVAAARS